MEGTIQNDEAPHILMLPTPGMGHLTPLAELAKQLVFQHNFTITLIIPSYSSPSKPMKTYLDGLPENINYTLLSPVSFDDQPADVRFETLIALSIVRSLPYIREEFKIITATKRVVALVTDLFGTDAFDIAEEFDIPSYMYFPTTALCLLLTLNLPHLDETYSCEYRDLPEPFHIPGCMPLPGSEFVDTIQDRKNEAYKWFLHQTKRYKLAEGILVNSFMELEPGAIKALMEEEPGRPPIYPVGPLVKNHMTSPVDESSCLTWLDDQPRGSVLFVSFGSGGNLSHEQLMELAYGLELSGQKFLWVVRSPNKTASASYFSHISNDPFDFLPDGFLDRTKGSGLLLHSWAPQTQILSHDSTGGFLTHCGWNSTLESIVNGVPMIAWPLYAEQKMNALMLVEDVKIALRPKANENGLIERDEISQVIKSLIAGEKGINVRNKIIELKESTMTVLSENGSSTKILAEVADKWKNH